MAAALVRGGRDTASEDEALAAFGLELVSDRPDDSIQVFPDNWPACLLFVAMDTQWRYSMVGRAGLDYMALPTVAQMAGIEMTPECFADVRVLEREVLQLMAAAR